MCVCVVLHVWSCERGDSKHLILRLPPCCACKKIWNSKKEWLEWYRAYIHLSFNRATRTTKHYQQQAGWSRRRGAGDCRQRANACWTWVFLLICVLFIHTLMHDVRKIGGREMCSSFICVHIHRYVQMLDRRAMYSSFICVHIYTYVRRMDVRCDWRANDRWTWNTYTVIYTCLIIRTCTGTRSHTQIHTWHIYIYRYISDTYTYTDTYLDFIAQRSPSPKP